MEKRQAILQQFKVRMEKKYGTINKDQASFILSKLLEKSKVSEKVIYFYILNHYSLNLN